MPSDSLARSALVVTIFNYRMRSDREPLSQLDEIFDMIDILRSVRAVTAEEVQDAFISALSRCTPPIYAALVNQLNQQTFKGEIVSIPTIRTSASSAFKAHTIANANSTGGGRRRVIQEDDDITPDEMAIRREELVRHAAPAMTRSTDKKQHNDKKHDRSSTRTCFACKATGADYHFPSKCEVIQAALQQHDGNVEKAQACAVVRPARTKVVQEYPPSSDEE